MTPFHSASPSCPIYSSPPISLPLKIENPITVLSSFERWSIFFPHLPPSPLPRSPVLPLFPIMHIAIHLLVNVCSYAMRMLHSETSLFCEPATDYCLFQRGLWSCLMTPPHCCALYCTSVGESISVAVFTDGKCLRHIHCDDTTLTYFLARSRRSQHLT